MGTLVGDYCCACAVEECSDEFFVRKFEALVKLIESSMFVLGSSKGRIRLTVYWPLLLIETSIT